MFSSLNETASDCKRGGYGFFFHFIVLVKQTAALKSGQQSVLTLGSQ